MIELPPTTEIWQKMSTKETTAKSCFEKLDNF